MSTADSEIERMERLMGPSITELLAARRQGMEQADAMLKAYRDLVEKEGDPYFYYNVPFETLRFYVHLVMLGQAPDDISGRYKECLSELDRIQPQSPQLPIYAAHMVFQHFGDADHALKLARQGLALAIEKADTAEYPGAPLYPGLRGVRILHALALRVELAVLAHTQPRDQRIVDILEELSSFDNVATGHDYDREKTINLLIESEIRRDSLRKLILKDREYFVSGGPRKYKRAIKEIDGWLSRLGQ
jgi:hypothetical protein